MIPVTIALATSWQANVVVHVIAMRFLVRLPSLPRVTQWTKGRYAQRGARTVMTASVTPNHVRTWAPLGQDPLTVLGDIIHSNGIGGGLASYKPVLIPRYGAMDELLRDEMLPA